MAKHDLNSSRRGFTLTEMAIVLGLIGTVLGGIWTAASMARKNAVINLATSELLTISQNIRAFYAGKTQIAPSLVGTEMTTTMEAANVFPTNMQLISTTDPNWGTAMRPASPFGSYVSIHVMSATTFRVSFYNLSSQQCAAFTMAVASLPNNGNGAGPFQVGSWYTAPASGGTPPQAYGASNIQALGPGSTFDAETATAMCGGTASSGISAEYDFTLH